MLLHPFNVLNILVVVDQSWLDLTSIDSKSAIFESANNSVRWIDCGLLFHCFDMLGCGRANRLGFGMRLSFTHKYHGCTPALGTNIQGN
jgi:hypothetical protein